MKQSHPTNTESGSARGSWLDDPRRLHLKRLRVVLERWGERSQRGDLIDDAQRLRADIDAALDPDLPPDQSRQRYASVRHRLEIFLEQLTRIGSVVRDAPRGR
jgi:hypothetical protein